MSHRNPSNTSSVTRRALMVGGAAATFAVFSRASAEPPAHAPMGRVKPPQPAPALTLLGEDNQSFELGQRLKGSITAMQLMFTRCTAVCPIQASLFAAVAPRLPRPDMRLLSVSIDPAHDTPAALTAWMARFGAHPAWRAAVPRREDVDVLLSFVRGGAPGPDRHTGQVYLFDRDARLAFRTGEMPSIGDVVQFITNVADVA